MLEGGRQSIDFRAGDPKPGGVGPPWDDRGRDVGGNPPRVDPREIEGSATESARSRDAVVSSSSIAVERTRGLMSVGVGLMS